MSKQQKPADIPAEAIAPELRRASEIREFARLFEKLYDDDFPAIAKAWEDARTASFKRRKVAFQ